VPPDWETMRDGHGRNDALFKLLGRAVRHCDDFEQLLDYAKTKNEQFGEPMEDARVVSTAKSVWKMHCDGRNWFGRPGAHLFSDDALPLIDSDPDLLRLLMFIRAQNRPGRPFMLTNSFHERWGWSEKRLARTRKRGLNQGYFRLISPAYAGHAAFYVWDSKNEERAKSTREERN